MFGELDGLEDEARRACSAAGARPHFLGAAIGSDDVAGLRRGPDDFSVELGGGGRPRGALGGP